MPTTVPRIVKHMTLAIMESRRMSFLVALEIARARLVELKDLRPGSEKDTVDKIQLTAKGEKREREKRRQPPKKSQEFDKLFERYGKKLKGKEAEADEGVKNPAREDET